ncbi:hypothetical protein [Rubellicoccus peritrichatus]|uniref:Uncharacterized protein n=1 Tax=Rubellicoccus peritrichatus TaxID=3080537 RepID=A0AAQ3LEP1_9BACT|nr:hypothetical protein [Puniceicoccus sp. CR14]WOO43209.1 hypothetical protein RZN69_08895 [Puniceicoccus sp. CR14]
MKSNVFYLFALTLTGFVSHASAEKTPPAAQDSMSALIVEHLTLREARRDELELSIIDLDARIEKRVTSLINMLSRMKDSKESGVKIMSLKESAIEGLTRNMRKLKTESANIERTIYQAPNNENSKDLQRIQKYFDDKIETRLDQLIQLTLTLSDKAAISKPKSGPKEYRRDAIANYKHDKQQQNRATKAEQEVINGVLASVDRLKVEAETLRQRLATITEPELRSVLRQSIDHCEDLITKREEQAYQLITGDRAFVNPTSRKEAVTVEKMIKDVSEDLKNDFTRLQISIQEYLKEIEAISALKDNLARR